MKHVSVGDARLAYAVHGAVHGPWVVMSSSLGADHRMWHPQLPVLANDFRVLVYDHRGHGQSSAGRLSAPWTIDVLVADVVALLDALGIDAAAFVGLSLGGSVGLGLALSRPDRVTSLMCCCARADAPQAYREFWRRRADSVRRTGTGSVVAATLKRWFTNDAADIGHDLCARAMLMLTGTSRDGYVGAATALTTLDYLERLGDIRVPTLYLAGERDEAIPVDVMQSMADLTPESRIVSIPGAAHLANMECPEAFNGELTTWLKRAA